MPALPTYLDLLGKQAVVVDLRAARVHEVAGFDVAGGEGLPLSFNDGVRVDLHGHAAVILAGDGDLAAAGGLARAVGGHRRAVPAVVIALIVAAVVPAPLHTHR